MVARTPPPMGVLLLPISAFTAFTWAPRTEQTLFLGARFLRLRMLYLSLPPLSGSARKVPVCMQASSPSDVRATEVRTDPARIFFDLCHPPCISSRYLAPFSLSVIVVATSLPRNPSFFKIFSRILLARDCSHFSCTNGRTSSSFSSCSLYSGWRCPIENVYGPFFSRSLCLSVGHLPSPLFSCELY